MRMEGSVGSGVLKKKNSSGCLIIKKPGLNKNPGGLGGLSDRLVESSSSSSDDDECLEIMRRRVTDKRLKNGCKRNEVENREDDRDSDGNEDSGERKRGRMDLFEFDEYDEFDERNGFLGSMFKRSVKMRESGVSSSRKRKQGSGFDGSKSGKNKGKGLEDDEAHMPISLLKLKCQEAAGESIRLQGKNGVLKVMVNKKKKMELSDKLENCEPKEDKERKRSRGDDVVKKDLSEPLRGRSELKTSEKRDKERSVENKKKGKNVEKVTPRSEVSSSKKRVKTEAEGSPEMLPPVKGKESKEGSAKRGGSTEKQKLREKIRAMLLDSGWTIDYRPRRNRDYLDAVYISPSGTAYWSIVKAYDAFKKHLEEDDDEVKVNVGSPSFAPLSEDLINKLTRQTKKKIAEEMKRKRKEDSVSKSSKRSAVREVAESSDSDQSGERLSSYIKQVQKSRGRLSKVDRDSDHDLSDGSPIRKPKKFRVEKPSTASNSNVIHGRTSKVTGRCTLLVRGSDRGENSDFDGYVPYKGKRTLLAWLIDSGKAKLSEKVQYMNRRRSRVMLEGWITRDGIHCGCCSKILTVSKFELHAGSKLRQPFQNIFLESGSSLLQCLIDAWNHQEESERKDFFTIDVDGDDPDDDTCGICGDGGDLICCDSCPSTFHQFCLGIKMLPSGDWYCANCTCKFCGLVSGNADEEINNAGDEINRCHFCEKKYHISCSERARATPMSSNGASFCGPKCQEIYDHLEKIIGIKHELDAGISWSLIQRKDVSDASQRGFPLRVECNAKLAVALSVMDECFLPIIDRRSGINMTHNVVYNCGSNFNRLNFDRFYTAVLERGDEIISAASIRLHGDRLAEMPFIGTREIYRRQGMCRRLLSAIETELRSLKVGQLIIPAISEHMNTWTTIFDFHELEDAHKKEIKSLNMLVFPGTDMLQKQLVKQQNTDGSKVSELTNNQPPLPISVEKSDVNSSSEQNKQASSDSEGRLEVKTKDEVDAPDSCSDGSKAVCESDIHTGANPEADNKQNPKHLRAPAEKDNSTDDKRIFLEPSVEFDGEDACKNESPCLETIQESLEQSSKCTVRVSENADNERSLSNGFVESRPGSVSETSLEDAIGKTNQNRSSTNFSSLPGDEASNVRPNANLDNTADVQAVDLTETGELDGENGTLDLPETEKLDGENGTLDRHHETDKPNGENGTVDCRHETDRPNGEIDTADRPETEKPKTVDCPEPDRKTETVDHQTGKPGGEIETVDRPETEKPKIVDCPETDEPDGETETVDRPETENPKIVDCPETDEPNGETETVDHQTGKPGGETETVDRRQTDDQVGDNKKPGFVSSVEAKL